MVTTSLLEDITQKAALLPVERQREALDFIEFLTLKVSNGNAAQPVNENAAEAPPRRQPFKSVIGSLEHLGINITDEDIAEARREMWANFPREFPE